MVLREMILLRRITGSFVFVTIAVLTLLAGCELRGWERGPDRGPVLASADEPVEVERADAPQFAPGQLEHHFQKHGAEMGFTNKEDYLRAAQDLVRGGPGVETLRRGGDTLFYKDSTNEFAVLSDRNVIRTYFRPDNGRRYWERQKQR